MAWKEPDLYSIKAPYELKEKLSHSYYYYSKGSLTGTNFSNKLFYYTLYITPFYVSFLLTISSSIFLPDNTFLLEIGILITSAILAYFTWSFFRFGWFNELEYWCHFDMKEEIITSISRENEEWDVLELPFEEIDEIRWSGGTKGRAEIIAGQIKLFTYREGTISDFTPHELWPKLARIGTKMTNWPFQLECPVCMRRFGNHFGTATCPFDKDVILLDPKVKGRIDPEEMTKEDIGRV